jgi:hypothetical protein
MEERARDLWSIRPVSRAGADASGEALAIVHGRIAR